VAQRLAIPRKLAYERAEALKGGVPADRPAKGGQGNNEGGKLPRGR
jgi:hypothetical protein